MTKQGIRFRIKYLQILKVKISNHFHSYEALYSKEFISSQLNSISKEILKFENLLKTESF